MSQNLSMKKLLLVSVALLACVPFASAQVDQQKRATEIMTKVRQIDMINQILPALFEKEQLRKILPVIEKLRAEVKVQEKKEYDILLKLEAKLDAQIKNATEKKEMPDAPIRKEIDSTFQAFSMLREAIIAEYVDKVTEILNKELNAGQKKAIQNAVNPKIFIPDADVTKWTDEQKFRFWIRLVILDPASYDILVKLSR
jgi:hypothetical protein